MKVFYVLVYVLNELLDLLDFSQHSSASHTPVGDKILISLICQRVDNSWTQ